MRGSSVLEARDSHRCRPFRKGQERSEKGDGISDYAVAHFVLENTYGVFELRPCSEVRLNDKVLAYLFGTLQPLVRALLVASYPEPNASRVDSVEVSDVIIDLEMMLGWRLRLQADRL